MPQLQTHMLRVAAVASVICDNFNKPLDKNLTVTTCLVHDIGSTSKINIGLFPEYAKEKGVTYWKNIQNDFIKKYGKDDHKAAMKICKELRLKPEITKMMKLSGFKHTIKIHKSNSLETKIFKYADMRVSPYGVLSLKERLEEARKRYLTVQTGIYTPKQFQKLIPIWSTIEEQIFYLCKIKPDDITERKVMPQMLKLKNFDIRTR
jgi:hypothetical protein